MSNATTNSDTHNTQQDGSSQVRQMVSDTSESLAAGAKDCTEHYVTDPAKDLIGLAKEYAKDKPEVAAAWAFMFGIVIGWKLKP